MCASPRRQTGATLVELVMFIVIVSVGAAGILAVMSSITQHSADPMLRQQAVLIAESYLEEILLKPFLDPSPPGATAVCSAPEATRAAYDNICDYDGLADNNGAVDQLGNSIAGLSAYNVAAEVIGDVGDGTTLHDINNTTPTAVLRVLRVEITVTHDNQPDLIARLTGYRTNYNCNTTGDAGCKPRISP